MRPLRTLLFVPGSRPRMLEKARDLTADAVILDLEDAVAPDEKQAARTSIRDALGVGTFAPQVVVRVNALSTGLAEEDLDAVICGAVQVICLPKAQDTDEIAKLDSMLGALEDRQGMCVGSTAIYPLIESALGVLNAPAIARSSDRVRVLLLGGEDLCRDLGAKRTAEGTELLLARGHVVLAARAAGIQAVDTVYTDLSDMAGLEADATLARQMGFSGKLLIHPKQIEPVSRAFAPSADEITWARTVVAAYEQAVSVGQGVAVVDGKMIDAPVVDRARETLAGAEEGRL